MPVSHNFKKIANTIKIYSVVQILLVLLLGYMGVVFQAKLQAIGRGSNFMNAVLISFVLQLLFFYPIRRFALAEANRDLAASASDISAEELNKLTKKARFADVVKAFIVVFYIIFMYRMPNEPVILSIVFFSFILTILSYFQCYNFAAKKLMKEWLAR
ncbi:hypothetical protein [Geomesophilobacter sediminis]|uniref:Uncharacterized protein n=1 Tax=Geomesophilobacter sediminis TaxID=2798584 RepID=A0A8J7LZ49_9BACT|nr:hypothetical protein [Geomesophilobacter sediminis]MBJ6726127.1 hypothetical protein [Geomesophilobacter sediminis]